MDNAKSSGEERVGGIGPPGGGFLEARSGGGRRPGFGHCKLSHRTPPPLFDFVPPAYHYLLLNSGFRFSVNALMPSSASSDTNTRPSAAGSIAKPKAICPP